MVRKTQARSYYTENLTSDKKIVNGVFFKITKILFWPLILENKSCAQNTIFIIAVSEATIPVV